MKRVLHTCFAVGALLIIVGAAGVLTSLKSRNTRVLDERFVFNFGQRRGGESVVHTFEIQNPYDFPLVVSRVRSSCSCTTPTELKSIGPLSTGTVDVTARLARDGPETFSAQVLIEFERHPPLALQMEGRVLYDVPEFVDFGQVLQDRENARTVTFRALASGPVRIRELRYDQSMFNVTYAPSNSNSRDTDITILLRKGVPSGRFIASLDIVTEGDTISGTRAVTLRGYVQRAIEADRLSVVFANLERNGSGSATLRIYSPYESPFSIVGTQVFPPTERVTVRPAAAADSAPSHTVQVEIQADSSARLMSGSIQIVAQLPDRRLTLDVPYYAVINEHDERRH